MKNVWFRRIIYLIIVSGTTGFALYQYKHSQKIKEKEEKKDLIFSSLKPAQVQNIFIQKEEGDIHLIRKADGWNMKVPVEDIADRDLTGDWLGDLFSEKARVINEKGVDWAEYGLDQNINSIELTTKSNGKLKLDISFYSAFDGSFYLRKGEKLLLGSTAWASLTRKDGDYFRSYKLLNISKKHPKNLHYKSQDFTVSLKWEGNKWKWENNNPFFPLSQSNLESYWSSFFNIQLEKEVYPNTDIFRKKFKLHEPSIEIYMEFEDDKKWSVKVSPENKDKFYVLPSTRDYIFVINKKQKNNLLLTNKKIRDHRYPFQFKRDQVHFIELKGYGIDLQAKKEEEQWTLLRGDLNKEIMNKFMPKSTNNTIQKNMKEKKERREEHKNKSKKIELKKDKEIKLKESELQKTLNRINILSARDYFDIKKEFTKAAELVLKNEKKEELLKLDFSEPFKEEANKEEESFEEIKSELVYVKSSAGKEIMTIRFDDLKFIFSRDLLQID